MRKHGNVFLKYTFCALLIYAFSSYLLPDFALSRNDVRYEKLDDGVERWYRDNPKDDKPWFFQELEKLFEVVLADKDKLPFGKSVAFLVGVSQYENISPQLPFVKNDLRDMRKFLLTKGGFGEVYVASGKLVNRDLIEEYIRNKFPRRLNKEDRLLFYYTGHGDDSGGSTGYMQFSKAKPGNFVGDQVLAIKDASYWCDEIDISHLLFIFDCCASGLAFTPKGDERGQPHEQMISTLSRNGSQTIITAGTANEKTFEVKAPGEKGNGVFTRAFLNAVENGGADKGKDGFMTIDEIVAQIKDEVAFFAAKYGQSVTPRLWPMNVGRYLGTFVFINPEAKNQSIRLSEAYADRIAATPISRGGRIASAYGAIQLISYLSGKVYIDNIYVGDIEIGDGIEYDRKVGPHKVEVRAHNRVISKTVEVIKGRISQVTIRPQKEMGPMTEPIAGMKFVPIPAGTFMMGSAISPSDVVKRYGGEEGYYRDEHPQHKVRISKPFYMQATEVTQGQWYEVMGTRPWSGKKYVRDNPDCPAVYILWDDCQNFIRRLNQKEDTIKYRLPTEAEWEYACRAGSTTTFHFGKSDSILGDYAWYRNNALDAGEKYAHTVGSKKANACGLYDMHGNVWEWCQDWYEKNYPSGQVTDPKGPSSGEYHVLRGGGWHGDARYCRSADRSRGYPGNRLNSGFGFRVARDL